MLSWLPVGATISQRPCALKATTRERFPVSPPTAMGIDKAVDWGSCRILLQSRLRLPKILNEVRTPGAPAHPISPPPKLCEGSGSRHSDKRPSRRGGV
jgi:hypothetical protein